jgi:hypothetical protein
VYQEGDMRSASSVCAAASVATASYLAASLGLDAARVLAMPLYGLEELQRSEPILAIRRLLALDPGMTMWMAACLGAAELAVMAVLIAYLVERLGGRVALPAAHQTLRAGLVLAASAAFATILGAAFIGNIGVIAAGVVQLAVVGMAALFARAELPAAPQAEAPRVGRWEDPRLAGWFAA